MHRGRALGCCARYSEAKADLDLVIEQSIDDPFVKGCAYNELGQHQEAVNQFNEALEDKSQTTTNKIGSTQISEDDIRFRRGLSYASLNSHKEAIKDYRYILERSKEPSSSSIIDRAYFRTGMSNMALKDNQNALINFNKSTAINDQQSDVFYARGMVHYKLGRHDAAVYDHRRAMQLSGQKSIPPSIYQSFYHTHHDSNNTILRNVYQNKLNAAEKALNECKDDDPYKIEYHRHIAEYYQQLAPYTHDPQATHQNAIPHIKTVLQSSPKPRTPSKSNTSSKSHTSDIVINAIHQLREAQILCEKYPGGIASKRIVQQFINSAATGIRDMSLVLEQCSDSQDWNDLFDTFTDLLAKSRSDPYSSFNIFRYETIRIQLIKAEMMKKTIDKFEGFPEQKEFYKLLFIRLCNIFDASRAASTGIIQHALTGTLGKVSWGFMILGHVFGYVPGFGPSVAQVLGFVEKGLQKLDAKQIQSALNRVGTLEPAQKLNETADEIAEKLATMYKWQIEQFPTSDKEYDRTNQDEAKKSCGCCKCCNSCTGCCACCNSCVGCCTCCNSCIGCCGRTMNCITNERDDTTMETIGKYAISLILGRLIETNTRKINTIIDLRDSFVNAVCNVSYDGKVFRMITANKIKLAKAKPGDVDWDTHLFFRGPVIQLPNGARLTGKHMDSGKFGYRGPSWNEEEWCEKNPKELEKLGLKKEETEKEKKS